MTSIKPCTCVHAFQDKMYGHGMRVKNLMGNKENTSPKWRCTVCGKEH